MKNEIIITAQGHQGTLERMQNEFSALKLWEAPDRDAALKAAAPRLRALAHFGHSRVDSKLMDALPKLELIANFGVGVDQIDLEAAKQRHIIVTNTPDVLNDCVADTAIALVLNTLRKFPQSEAYLRSGYWPTRGPYPLATSVGGKTLGILGLGRIGEAIAKRALAFGMQIRYHNRHKKNVPYAYDANPVALAKNSHVLLIVTPGGAGTAKLVNAKVLDALGPQGYVVNVARGSVVDEPVLLRYLREKKIAGAGLDVFEHEPKVPAEFYALDNAVLFPHVASATIETRKAMGDLQVENLHLHFAGKPVKTRVV
ncbi:MAG: 2-hydroxyacid dehydrogenase [Betaproteobacteria bacterium]|nr:2-hydroxyacid dehydrogenase [Betaproteobacteria bacterium]MSQ87670.1 2-hydroxyacid dehydrogenase [Betaproteobacteria bacterium]